MAAEAACIFRCESFDAALDVAVSTMSLPSKEQFLANRYDGIKLNLHIILVVIER